MGCLAQEVVRLDDEHVERVSAVPLKVAVVGAGHVGSTFAYALLLSGLASEIVLVDADRARAEGEALDLSHAAPLAYPVRVLVGDYVDCRGAAVTVVAAGVSQKKGEGRLDLLRKNAVVFREVVPRVAEHNPDGVLLVATNPVDVLTYAAWRWSSLPAARVIGSGTELDTARFRHGLSRHFGVDPHSVHAWIIGEHGDSEVPVWSLANIAGMRLAAFCAANGVAHDPAAMEAIFRDTRDAAYAIIARKGATYYAVAVALLRIVEAIVRDQRTVFPVSSLVNDAAYGISDVCLSVPAVLGRGGVERLVHLDLSPSELASLRQSASMLRTAIAQLGLEGL